MRFKLFSSALLVGSTLAATPVLAQDAPASPFTVTGSAAVVSSYRYRGISQSNNKAAIQGAFTVAHESGFYVSTWGSSTTSNYAGTEIDVYGGWTKALGDSGVTVDVGGYGYIYPNASDFNYYEVYGSIAKSYGPVGAKVGVYFAPDQENTSKDSLYIYGDLSFTLPSAPITFSAHLGRTNGALEYLGDSYLDYSVGVSYKWNALTFGVSYVGTDVKKSYLRGLTTFDDGEGGVFFDQDTYRSIRRPVKGVVVGSITASF